jgi:hypothetical protein
MLVCWYYSFLFLSTHCCVQEDTQRKYRMSVLKTISKITECQKRHGGQWELFVSKKDTHNDDCVESSWLCPLTVLLDPGCDTSRPLLWLYPSLGTSLFPGDALGQGHFPEWNFLLPHKLLPVLVAKQWWCSPEGLLRAGRPVHHPICNLNSLTGRGSQAVHLRLQKVRLKYKEYPMPQALHKFCFDSNWERDGERGS